MDKDRQENLDWGSLEHKFLETATNQKITRHSYNNSKNPPAFDYREALEGASKSMIRFKKPEHLIKQIVQMIDREVGTSHTAVLLYKEKKDSYVLIDSKGAPGKKIPVGYIRLLPSNPLVSVFTERGKLPLLDESGALTYGRIKRLLSDKRFMGDNASLAEMARGTKTQMELLQADICVPSYFKKKLLGVLILGRKLSSEEFTRSEMGFFLTLANDAAMAISNAQLIENLQEKIKETEVLYNKSRRLFINTTIALAAAVDARDPYTHGHTERVTAYCLAIAEEMQDRPEVKDTPNFRENLHIAALLHDIGKIGIPDSILNKEGKLTPEEYEKIKEHPVIGTAILYPIKELGVILGGVRSHQERFDGAGYPDGLKGLDIPLLARIIAVADAFDAMTSNRPYRTKKSIEKAVAEIKECSGTQFDPDVAQAFARAYEKRKFFNTV